MSDDRVHQTPYRPRWYRRRMSVWWWLKNRAYAKFVLREMTSVFVALFAALYLWQLRALAQGPDAYARSTALLKTPLFLVLDTVALLFVLFHDHLVQSDPDGDSRAPLPCPPPER